MNSNLNPNQPSPHSWCNQLRRVLWALSWWLLFRFSTRARFTHAWRAFLLRLFGARIGRRCRIYPTVKIWWPGNLIMADDSTLGPGVECANVAIVSLGKGATVSQYTYLCTTSHDISDPLLPVISAPIHIDDYAWVTACCLVGMGVTVGEGAVTAMGAVVVKDVAPWTVVGGNPAKFIKSREVVK